LIEKHKPPTIFLDIDGCLILHSDEPWIGLPNPILLEGTIEKLWELINETGCKIVLTTARKESLRPMTEKHLQELGIVYDYLLMGLGSGKRYLINDLKPGSDEPMAIAINLERNQGIRDITL
jgi:hypothetical protein